MVTMRELVIDLLDLWFIVPYYLGIDWYLMFTTTASRSWVDGFLIIIYSTSRLDLDQFL